MSEVISGKVDVEVIGRLIEDILSQGDFYIAFEEALESSTSGFLEYLELNEIPFRVLDEGNEDEFKSSACDEDVLLAISEEGDDEFVLDMARFAKSQNAKVYVISTDSENELCLLADEALTNEVDFSIVYPVYLQVIINMLNGDFHERDKKTNEQVMSFEEPSEKPQGNVFPQFSGAILEICVKVGDRVNVGDKLYVADHMMIVTEIFSEIEGTVKEIYVKPGDIVFPDEDCIMNIEDENPDVEDPLQSLNNLKRGLIKFNLSKYDVLIHGFVDDVGSWGTVYIVCDDDLRKPVSDFQAELEAADIDCVMMSPDMEDEFKNGIGEGDVLLAVSNLDGEDSIEGIVRIAKLSNSKVYTVCNDFKGDLALFSDEAFIIENDFNVTLQLLFERIVESLEGDFYDDVDDIIEPVHPADDYTKSEANVTSPMYGMIISISVKVGDRVKPGDELCVIEAMKMENRICSEIEGIVKKILVNPGDSLSKGQGYMEIVPSSSPDADLIKYDDAISDFVDDVGSWGMVYIVCDDDLRQPVSDFQAELEFLDIDCVAVSEDMEDEFKKCIGEDDVLLAVSNQGGEDSVEEIVKIAKLSKARVYAICSDFKGDLSLFSKEALIIEDGFNNVLPLLLKRIIEVLEIDLRERQDEIISGHSAAPEDLNAPGNVISPCRGIVVEICVNEGDEVKVGDRLCVIEVMKMENEILSDFEGTVKAIHVKPQEVVGYESILMNIGGSDD